MKHNETVTTKQEKAGITITDLIKLPRDAAHRRVR